LVKELNKAIILAAGKGSRLQNILKGKPKSLLKIKGRSLLNMLIDKLLKLNIKKIVIVTGFKSSKIKREIRKKVKFVYYPNFNKTNNLHTLLHVKDELSEPFVCLFSDVIFEIKILKKLISQKGDFVLAIDKKSNLLGTMRVKVKKNSIREIGSHIELKNSDGNFIGFSKFSKNGAKILKRSLISFKGKNFNNYYTESLNKLIKQGEKVSFVDISNFQWKEIDTSEDFTLAKKILKKILLNER